MKTQYAVGDVVQLSGNTNFPYSFMTITELKSWGAQGYVTMPGNLGEKPSQAYYRVKWEHMEHIGKAVWTVSNDSDTDGEEDAGADS